MKVVYWMQCVFDAGAANRQGWEQRSGAVVNEDDLYVVVQTEDGKRKMVAKTQLINDCPEFEVRT